MLTADPDCSNENDNLQNISLVATPPSQIIPVSSSHANQLEIATNIPENKVKKSKSSVVDISIHEDRVKKKIKIDEDSSDLSKPVVTNYAVQDKDKEFNLISSTTAEDEQQQTDAKRKSSSVSVQTSLENLHEASGPSNSNLNETDITIPLSIITLQSILISARTKAETEISPKQFGAYQICKDIILLLQGSLRSERDAYDFIGRPVKDVSGHPIDRVAWWFWIIQKSVKDLNPPPGYILPALKMLRQEITSLADNAVEIINVQKTIHKQLRRMAGILNGVFVRYDDICGVRDWEHKLRKTRSEEADTIEEKYETWLRTSSVSPPPDLVKLTCLETKSLLLQHGSNPDYAPVSLNKIDLRKQTEFIKSCLHHMNSLLRQSCMDSLKAHEDLNKAEKEIEENIDKLVKKLENLRRVHRFRETTCAVLLKKSLTSLGLCLYEFIDIVIFIRKLGRFVLLASEHVLRYANNWSHICDVTCLSQLDNVLSEISEGEAFVLFQCFEKWSRKDNKVRKREKVMTAFEEYFQQWNVSNISTVQVQFQMNMDTAKVIFGKEDEKSSKKSGSLSKKSECIVNGKKTKTKVSIPDIYSTKEVDITFIAKGTRPIPIPMESHTDIDTVHKLEEIGIRLDKETISGKFNQSCNAKGNQPTEMKSLSLKLLKEKNNTSKGKIASDQEHKPKLSTPVDKIATSNLEYAS